MSRLLYFDRKLFTVTLGLLATGLVMIYSSSAVLALTRKGDPAYFFKHQMVWAAIGVVALFVTQHIPYAKWGQRKIVLGLMALEVILLLLALASPAINGSHRWIKLGPMTLQPSETAKLVILILAAYLLNKRTEERREWIHTLVPLSGRDSIDASPPRIEARSRMLESPTDAAACRTPTDASTSNPRPLSCTIV